MDIPSNNDTQLDLALELALEARAADEAGDLDRAKSLRVEHDAIFMEIEKCLPQQK
jgi:hypothetical protein